MAVITNKSPFNIANAILALSIGILVIVVAVPVLLIFINSFWVDGQFNITDVVQILKQQETYEALLNSLFIASGVTIMSTCVGTFFAWLVTRTDLPYKGFMKVMFLVPFMLPSFIGALAWKMLLSPRAGYINQFFMDTLGFEEPVFNIYSYAGIMAVETMYLFPFVFIQVCGALERMDPTLEESARISGASLFTITRKITIPLVMPSIVSGALLIMLYSMAHFGTVAVLGIENGIFNIPTLIYERIHHSAGSFDAIRTGNCVSGYRSLYHLATKQSVKSRTFPNHCRKKFPTGGSKAKRLTHAVINYLPTLYRFHHRIANSDNFLSGRLKNLRLTNHLGKSHHGKLQVYPI